MALRAAGGPLCLPCYRKDPAKQYPCARCGRRRPVSRRLDGSGLCEGCAPRLHRTCTSCGQPGVTATLTGDKVICRRCYRRPERECGVCGRYRPAKVTGGSDGLALCSRCYRTSVPICLACSSIGPCDHDTAPAADAAGQVAPAGHRRLISQPMRRCDSCGRDRAAEADWPRGWICRTCYVRVLDNPGPCPVLRREVSADRPPRRQTGLRTVQWRPPRLPMSGLSAVQPSFRARRLLREMRSASAARHGHR
jgi:hypothetical protein